MATKKEVEVDYIESVVTPFLTKPKELKTVRTVDDKGVLLVLTAAKEDMGKLIGKEGKTAKALRHLLRVLGGEQSVFLKIGEISGKKEEK